METSKALICLALFPDDVIMAICEEAKNRGTGQILADINKGRTTTMPPAVFGLLKDKYVGDGNDASDMAIGLSAMMIYAFREMGKGTKDYKNVLVAATGVDETQAGKWAADDINTFDDATGWGNLGWAAAQTLQLLTFGTVKLDANTKKDDVDMPFEILCLGRVIREKGYPRWRLSGAAISDTYGVSVEEAIQTAQATAQGDIFDPGSDLRARALLERLAGDAHIPTHLQEMGGPLGDKLKKLAGKAKELIGKVASGPLATTAANLLTGGGAGAVTSLLKGGGAAPAVAVPGSASSFAAGDKAVRITVDVMGDVIAGRKRLREQVRSALGEEVHHRDKVKQLYGDAYTDRSGDIEGENLNANEIGRGDALME